MVNIYSKIDKFVDENTPRIIERMKKENLSMPSLEDGKKLRGNLTMLVAHALGGNLETALDYAAAVEFIHSGSLEHDDVLDGHDERHGKPTNAFVEGIQKAILKGDVMFCAANRVASENGNKAAVEVANAMQNTLDGVLNELSFDKILQDAVTGTLERDLYSNIVDSKTGALFSCAARFGAMSFNENDDIVEVFGQYGMLLGESYQIADDVVDVVQMSDGTKEITPISIVGVLPALLNYEGSLIKRIPMMMLRKSFSMTDLFGVINEMDIETKMMNDLHSSIDNCILKMNCFDTNDIGAKAEYIEMLRAYPIYAVNRMLNEIGEKYE